MNYAIINAKGPYRWNDQWMMIEGNNDPVFDKIKGVLNYFLFTYYTDYGKDAFYAYDPFLQRDVQTVVEEFLNRANKNDVDIACLNFTQNCVKFSIDMANKKCWCYSMLKNGTGKFEFYEYYINSRTIGPRNFIYALIKLFKIKSMEQSVAKQFAKDGLPYTIISVI